MDVISDYARSWTLLQGYDEQSLGDNKTQQAAMIHIELDQVLEEIADLKKELINKGEATPLFGQLRGDGLAPDLFTIE